MTDIHPPDINLRLSLLELRVDERIGALVMQVTEQAAQIDKHRASIKCLMLWSERLETMIEEKNE